jgi:hypothetical protein
VGCDTGEKSSGVDGPFGIDLSAANVVLEHELDSAVRAPARGDRCMGESASHLTRERGSLRKEPFATTRLGL